MVTVSKKTDVQSIPKKSVAQNTSKNVDLPNIPKKTEVNEPKKAEKRPAHEHKTTSKIQKMSLPPPPVAPKIEKIYEAVPSLVICIQSCTCPPQNPK